MSPDAGRAGAEEGGAGRAAGVGQAGQSMGAGLDRMDRIRDILFGKEMEVYEKKLGRLEERLAKEAADLRDDLRKRFDSLETYTKKEVEALVNQAKAEQQRREEALQEVSLRLKDATTALERKLGQLDEKKNAGEKELREQVLGQMKAEQTTRAELLEELSRKFRETTGAIEKKLTQLEEKSTSSGRELGQQVLAQMKGEQDARTESVHELTQKLKDLGALLERKFSQLEEKTIASERALREQILNQSKVLTDDLRQKYDEFRAALEQDVQELRNDKMDRTALSSLLTEMSMRINRELENLQLPGGR